MKTVAFFMIFLQIFLSSCDFWPKVDASNFNSKYINSQNKDFEKKIEEYGNYVLKQTKTEFENNLKNWVKVEKPKIYSEFREYNWKWIKSVVYKIYKKISEKEENIVKVFYLKGNKEILKNEIIDISDEKKKEKLIEKLIPQIIKSGVWFKDKNILKENLNKNISYEYFYLKDSLVYFIFEEGIVWEKSLGNIEISINFDELYDFINIELFPEIKEMIKRKRFYETFEKDKANGKYEEVTKKFNNWKKYVSLTFDDGPNPKTTNRLLDILKKHNVKVTFFNLWKNAELYPDVVKRQAEEWHEIASHSWSHPSFLTLNAENIKKQISMTDEALKKAAWVNEIKLFRPPYWAQNQKTNDLVWKTIVMWDVDSMDWKNRNVQKNLTQTLAQVKNGSIILYHDIHEPSVDTIEPLIKALKERWYEFLTTGELLEMWQWDIKRKICHNEFNCKKY